MPPTYSFVVELAASSNSITEQTDGNDHSQLRYEYLAKQIENTGCLIIANAFHSLLPLRSLNFLFQWSLES
jgi:hypothetical protein